MIVYVLGLIGVAVFAFSGALAAGRKGLDWVGVVALGVVTALGGGTLRDVLLDREAVFWIADVSYLWTAVAASVFTIVYVRVLPLLHNALQFADALGLALFTILGAQVAEDQQAPALVVVTMGVLTGVAGGLIRDVLSREVPFLFRSSETLYSVAALGGAVLYVALRRWGVDGTEAALCGVAAITLVRLAAIVWTIHLPAFHTDIRP